MSITPFNQTEGMQGRTFEIDPARLVFLAARAPHGTARWPSYGSEARTDVAGIFQKLGLGHYRLVIPEPRDGMKMEIVDMKAESALSR